MATMMVITISSTFTISATTTSTTTTITATLYLHTPVGITQEGFLVHAQMVHYLRLGNQAQQQRRKDQYQPFHYLFWMMDICVTTQVSSFSMMMGLVMNSLAPSLKPRMMSSLELRALRMTI